MTMHQVEYEYKILEGGAMNIDLDPALDPEELELIALAEIKESVDDFVTDVEIIDIKEIN